MKPPCGHSSRVLPTLDTGDDLVGLLHDEQTGEAVSQSPHCREAGPSQTHLMNFFHSSTKNRGTM